MADDKNGSGGRVGRRNRGRRAAGFCWLGRPAVDIYWVFTGILVDFRGRCGPVPNETLD